MIKEEFGEILSSKCCTLLGVGPMSINCVDAVIELGNENNIPFRVPSGLSFVTINNKTGLPSSDKESIMEAFIEGSEPYTNDDISILDSLGIINNSISGTGGLLIN